MIRILAAAVYVLLISAAPAEAGAVAAAVSAVSAWFAGLSVVGQALVRIGVGYLLSRLAGAQELPQMRPGGISVPDTQTGGVVSESFVIGRYATGGNLVCPPLTWGKRLSRLVYVVDLGCLPGQTLQRLIVNDAPMDFGTEWHEDGRGLQMIGGGFDPHVHLRHYDGTQTAADPYLLDKLGDHRDYPWRADMIGAGRPYAVVTFYLASKEKKRRFNGAPRVRFEVMGIPLYDPRRDDSVGGSGAQRWNDPSTWAPTQNPVVMVYNIKRGIRLPDGSVWGGDARAEDLPLGNWIAAMNECDRPIALLGGGTEPQFRAGIEIRVAEDQPADVIEQLLATCSGEVAEEGGTWWVQVGAVALPSYFLTDEDLIISEAAEMEPFPGLQGTENGVAVTYPEPSLLWEETAAPVVTDQALIDADGGRRQIARLPLRACPYGTQAERLARGYLMDARRFVVHRLALPPDAAWLPPLASVSWVSAHNGYTGKVFEVQRKQVGLRTLLAHVALRERDPGDFDWSPAYQTPAALPVLVADPPAADVLAGVMVLASAISDGSAQRRPAVVISWQDETVAAVDYEIRLASGAVLVSQGTVETEAEEITVSDGLLPDVLYEARVRAAGDGLDDFTPWIPFRTLDVRLSLADFEDSLRAQIEQAAARHDVALSDATGALGALRDAAERAFGSLDRPGQLAADTERLSLAVDDAFARLWGLEFEQFTQGELIARAGIYVDEETGVVRIRATEATEQRVSSVEIGLAAAEARLDLSASRAYVNQQLAAVVLDPSQIPYLDDLDLRISSVELTLDAEAGRLDTLAETLTVEGGLVSMTTVTERLDSIEGVLTLTASQADLDALGGRVSTAETALSALGDVASLVSSVGVTAALAQDLDRLEQLNLADLWDRFEGDLSNAEASAAGRRELRAEVEEDLAVAAEERLQLLATQGDLLSTVNEERIARVASGEALAQALAELGAVVDGVSGTVSGLASVAVTAEGAVAAVEDAISAYFPGLAALAGEVEDTRATVTDLEAVAVDAEGAVAAVEAEISAQFGGLSAMASAVTTARATADGLSAAYVLRLSAGGAEAGLELVAADGVDGPVSSLRIAADQLILPGTVTGDHLAVESLSAVSATLGLFRSAPTGARTEIEDDRISVFDEAGALRVRLGRLD